MWFRRTSGLDALLQRPEQESFLRRFLRSPVTTTARLLYNYFTRKHPIPTQQTDSSRVRVVCISDTHNTQPQLPDGDILIHAGDLTQSGTQGELNAQIERLDAQPHRHKVVIAGNHELCLDPRFSDTATTINWKSLIYLQNTSTTLEFGDDYTPRRLKVFGSPYTPKHGNWAFECLRTNSRFWGDVGIPEDTDILITHGPPRGHLDLGWLGCSLLLERLWEIKRRPRLHVFGHIHGGYGAEIVCWDAFQRVYEGVMDRKVGWVGVVKSVYLGTARALLGRRFGLGGQDMIMVNAAVVGGVRDEKRREAICIDI
ncbi:Metallo-dependent phosphatase [Aspergillus heteromorphus CBS 117.55]|uniref:Metallo-dependent phosphatase n=1 Tax=Aspergillus heteromorphus CBS 117.55 TaxID=1448321 RepID=A0A317V1S8_9EURO|nr:Metallo-dependent phosphatase [Aspergillus heteromorphus CBS 117.55]PWY66747.1 Metallo-dependent phosphatase [Aspergillus heteromorphus CBS 117.55]